MGIIEKVKLLLKINSEVKKAKEAYMNNGIGSSGFIMTILGLLVTVLMAFWGAIKPETLALAVVILPAIYTVSRAFIKASASKKDDEIFNAVLAKLQPVFDKLGVKTEPIDTNSSVPINTPK